YLIASTFKFANADVRTNAAEIVLDGPAAQIVNQSNVNALSKLAVNTAAGRFTLQNGRDLTISQGFVNVGVLTVGANSKFTFNGFTQTAGITHLAGGTLGPSPQVDIVVDIQGGVLSGSGTVNADLRNAGSVQVGGTGAAGLLVVNGSYSQTVAGTLDLEIGGVTPGSEFDQFRVNGSAPLDGPRGLTR